MSVKRKMKVGKWGTVPALRLSAQLLEFCGISVGDIVQVEYTSQGLTVKKVKENE